MDNIAIVAVAYNRANSLARLLDLLKESYYYGDKVDLIISIDKSDQENLVVDVANRFEWGFGKKIVKTFSERQGLRNHILQCGDITEDYSAVIIFEDDIIPAKDFYNYSREALHYYGKNKNVAGISLYAPSINEMIEKPFLPLRNDSDVYFMQSAQSWGQCWNKSMWWAFRNWYANNNEELVNELDMPDKIYSWPKTSWKKYFMKYITISKKYFVYPYISLSTNASEVGQHVRNQTKRYQVPILYNKKEYRFVPLEDGMIYDVFFENENLYEYISLKYGIEKNDICIDIYGSKRHNFNKRYVLTSRQLNFEIINSFSLSLKPEEMNVIMEIPGSELFLYDLTTNSKMLFKGKNKKVNMLEYYSILNWKDSLIIGIDGLRNAITKRLFYKKRG